MAYSWAKVYIEILDDHKMGLLPDSLWRRVIELILLAKKNDKDGWLPGLLEMSWTLRIPAESLEADLTEIAKSGIVQLKSEGWYLTNFVKRQAAEPAIERVRNFRKRSDKQDCNDDVTQSNQTKTRLDKDIGANAQQPKPTKRKTNSDPRTSKPAIQACRTVASRFPPIALYDSIIEALGNADAVDIEKLRACYVEWLGRGYNANSWKWAMEWYVSGIPKRNGNKPPEPNQPKPSKVYK